MYQLLLKNRNKTMKNSMDQYHFSKTPVRRIGTVITELKNNIAPGEEKLQNMVGRSYGI
jgi:hypothetical protein